MAGFRSNRSSQNRPAKRGYRENVTQSTYAKHSGCTAGTGKTGKPYIQGWRLVYGQMCKMIASPAKEFKTKSENSDRWIVNLVCGINKAVYNGFYNVETKKLTIPDLGLVANPKAPNGGYFGKF